MLARIRSLWRNLVRRRQADADVDDELRSVFDLLVEDRIAGGLSPADARRAATLQLGRISSIRTEIVQSRSGAGLEQLTQDVRFGARLLRRNPLFAATATASLAVGIGATTSIFTIVNAVVLRELPIREPRQLIEIGRMLRRGPGFSFSYPANERLRDQSRAFTSVMAFSRETIDALTAGGAEGAGRFVSGNFFDTLGVAARAGRLLSPRDDRIGAPDGSAVAVISDRFWRRAFNGSASALGEEIRIDANRFTIVGILPASFDDVIVGRPVDFFIPLSSEALVEHDSRLRVPAANWLGIAGRLRAGDTMPQAQADLEPALASFLADVASEVTDLQQREAIRSQRLLLRPASRGLTDVRPDVSSSVLLLIGAVALVLLIACVNVMALLMARGVRRRREISLRLSLGASRGRLIRQLLTESALLAATGAAIGLAVTTVAAPLVVGLLTDGAAPLVLDVRPDARVFLFTAVVAAASALIAGTLPALRTARAELTLGLHADARSTGTARGTSRWGRVLIAAQVALALVLVAGAALLLTTLRNIRRIDPGFDATHVLLLTVNPSRVGYADERLTQYWREVLAAVRSLPGVEAASAAQVTPLSGGGIDRRITVEGRLPGSNDQISANRVSEGFFATMSTPLVLGRDFTDNDARPGRQVVIINEALARRYFNGGNPIGRHLALNDGQPKEIIGVVANAKYYTLREADAPTAYLHWLNQGEGGVTLSVRTSGPPAAMAEMIRSRVVAIAPSVPIGRVRTLARQVERTLAAERLLARLLSAFAILALALACVGLYGVLGYSVAHRTGEIGLRMALGASRGRVLRSILREAAIVVAIGAAAGIPAATLLSRPIAHLLYGVTAADPRLIAGTVGCLLAAALAAAAAPAYRAARVDPVVALRQD
jgi:predicted permease